MLETPFEVARRQGVILSGRFEPTNPRSEGSLVVMWSSPSQRQAQEARVEYEMERRPGQLRFKLTTATPIKSLESSELSFDVRSLEDSQIHEIDIVAGLSEDKAKLNGRINLNPAQREVDVTATLPNYNPLRVLIRVGSQASTYTVENRVDWGTGTFVFSFSSMNLVIIVLFHDIFQALSPCQEPLNLSTAATLRLRCRSTVLNSVSTTLN